MSTDLSTSVKKSASAEESAPKRKHVRACIVHTWDHKTSKAFWNALKLQPLLNDEVQAFKALIVIHKVLQEGHPIALKEGFKNKDWLINLGRGIHGDGVKGYGSLIKGYVKFIVAKLDFHHQHSGFNGVFEYEEYISLKTTSDPNEGYEAILDLMGLQEQIDDFQKMIFSTINHTRNNECRISALVPLIAESYGIYKFITSMMRAVYKTTGEREALLPLVDQFEDQHSRLLDFYSDAQSIRFLTTLVTIPRLGAAPPDIFIEGSPEEPQRLAKSTSPHPASITATPEPAAVAPPPEVMPQQASAVFLQPTGMQMFSNNQQQFELEQQRLEHERQQQILQQQQQQQQQQQAMFEQQQLQQQEAAMRAEQELRTLQLQHQTQGRVAELERDLLTLKNQYDNDQLLLQQYDSQMRTLELELSQLQASCEQQLGSKNESITNFQEQILMWKSKYDSLAKLYSQLRSEHLTLLNKFKKLQQKAASADESIEKKEKMSKEMKLKNIELADLIRERDRARLELDRLKGGKDSEISKLEAELRQVQDSLSQTEKQQSSNLTAIFDSHQKELLSLKAKLLEQTSVLESVSPDTVQELSKQLAAKDDELEIMHQTMENALHELSLHQDDADKAIDEQIDEILSDNITKFKALMDCILRSNIQRIQSAVFAAESNSQAGNQLSTPEFLLSLCEECGVKTNEFAFNFNDYIADGPNGDHSKIISSSSEFVGAVCDILLNSKGITRLFGDEEASTLLRSAKQVSGRSEALFLNLLSSKLDVLSDDEKFDQVINSNISVQESLQDLIELVETLNPMHSSLSSKNVNLGELVEDEMNQAAKAISAASDHLQMLLTRSVDPSVSSIDTEINKAILSAAIAITNAIAQLIKAATETQQEIVAAGKGSTSRAAFYKKHNRWTEGLISASKSVAESTNILIKTADGVLSGSKSYEELIVASNEVAASTAQLVAASRVKASFMSTKQDGLEAASQNVTRGCKALVDTVRKLIEDKGDGAISTVDYSKLSSYENKTAEMEQQVEILKLENMLSSARKRLGEIRKYGYRADESDSE
ncbi:hypothetical protein BABINDRAFT_161291 [Babjeviella inositovora NRRL Y-12698]|uniref:I/LWEQ domain-containing protein n=1 Tax=Babjeviella inositovora NRRL Y-12698 TaxID=984486 RepID=A0A1E3QRS4_9ASCO|nr:uncharacterized protein BABINDRAFT_161291 [Babjeviella inositovora NRRL Y-12698]ODQ80338.1 hypothetical protein BABINDRAFT_161291 [Babjeviella inositovora NRRL Y-12698]